MIAFAFIGSDGIPTGGGVRQSLPDHAVPLHPPYTTADLPRIRFRNDRWEERDDLVPDPVPGPEEIALWQSVMLQRARAEAVARINARVGALRKRIYTDIPGQDAMYLEKRAEAVAYVAETNHGGEPETLRDYPLLANEVGITAPSAWTLAQIWLNRSDQFKRVGAETERARMQAVIAIATAPDFETIETFERDFNEALNGLPL